MFNLYEKIDKMCKDRGLTVAKMCSIAGLRSSVLYDLKSGKKKGLNFTTIQKIATVLDVSTDEFQEEQQKTFSYKTKEPPITDGSDEQITQILRIIDELPTEKLESVLDYLRFLNQSDT